MPEPTALERALRTHDVIAKNVVSGAATLVDLASAADSVALEARSAALRQADDGWGTTMSLPEVLAQRVGDLRATIGWTQERLATEMSAMGLDWKRITVAEVERCARRLSLDEILAIAALAGQPLVAMLHPPEGVSIEVNETELPPSETFALLTGAGGARAVADAARVVQGLLRGGHHATSNEDGGA